MPPLPILRRDLRSAAKGRSLYILRGLAAAGLGAIAVVPGLVALRWGKLGPDGASDAHVRAYGRAVLISLTVVQVVAWAFLVPGQVGGAIARERERDTLDGLLLTRLSSLEIAAQTLAGRLLAAWSAALAGLPAVLLAGCAAGVGPEVPALIAAGSLSTVTFMGTLSLYASARCRQAGTARALAFVLVWAWLLGLPVMTAAPLGAAGWGELTDAVRMAGGWVAASSPLALVVPPTWGPSPWAEALRAKVARMVGTQAALGALVMLGAASALGDRTARRPGVDPFRGYRPACGDDPIFWREHDLPTRRGSPPMLLVMARHLLTLLRQLAVLLIQVLLQAISLAIPIGVALAVAHYAAPAFAERWQFGTGPGGPRRARDEANDLARNAICMLAFGMLGGLASAAQGRITRERDKGTWSPLLTTPLSGREILGGKMRASARGLRPVAWILGGLLALAVACDAVNLPGALWVALDLPLAAWAGLALGTWRGARAGAKDGASSAASLGSFALAAVHIPLAFVALAPPRAVTGLLALGLALPLALVSAATAWMARTLTRRSFDRFDEWAGRPHRGVGEVRPAP